MRTPDRFIATDDNITALTECCFQPTTWQSQVYLGEERSWGPSLHQKTLKGYLPQTVKTVSLKTVLCVPGKRYIITGFFCETCYRNPGLYASKFYKNKTTNTDSKVKHL